MNAHELLSDAPQAPGDSRANLLYARLLLTYLADPVYELSDASKFREWLRALAGEARNISASADRVPRMPQPRYAMHPPCPDCDHEHSGREECGHYLGEGKVCKCPSKAPA